MPGKTSKGKCSSKRMGRASAPLRRSSRSAASRETLASSSLPGAMKGRRQVGQVVFCYDHTMRQHMVYGIRQARAFLKYPGKPDSPLDTASRGYYGRRERISSQHCVMHGERCMRRRGRCSTLCGKRHVRTAEGVGSRPAPRRGAQGSPSRAPSPPRTGVRGGT